MLDCPRLLNPSQAQAGGALQALPNLSVPSLSLSSQLGVPLRLMTLPQMGHLFSTYPVYCSHCLVAKSCLTLCDPMDSSPPWDSPGKNTREGCQCLLQGVFLTQGSNTCLWHWQMGSSPLSHQGSLLCVCSAIKISFNPIHKKSSSQLRGECMEQLKQ